MTAALHIVDARTPADMLDQLATLAGPGDRVVSLGPPPCWPGFDRAIQPLHCPLGAAALGGLYLRRIARREEPLHFWSPRAASALRTLPRWPLRRVLLSLPACPQAKEARRIGGLILMERLTVTLPTAAARDEAARLGLPASALAVLPPPAIAVDADALSRRRTATRKAMGIADGQTLLLAPAEMYSEAGHKYASWVHAILRQMLGDVLLAMPFGGPARKHVECFAHTTGYDDEVFLPDRWPGGLGLLDALAAADLTLLLATRDADTAALAAAMAAGSPIVATGLPQHCEMAPDGQAALLVPPDDPRAASAAALQLIDERPLAQRLGAAAAGIARRRFDPATCRQRLADLYAGR